MAKKRRRKASRVNQKCAKARKASGNQNRRRCNFKHGYIFQNAERDEAFFWIKEDTHKLTLDRDPATGVVTCSSELEIEIPLNASDEPVFRSSGFVTINYTIRHKQGMGRPIKVSGATRFKFGRAVNGHIEYDLPNTVANNVDFGEIRNICWSIEPYNVRKEP